LPNRNSELLFFFISVKEETGKIQEELLKNDQFKYNYPAKEITISYEDDEKNNEESNKSGKKLIVEIHKKRPSWFNKDLTTKVVTNSKS
jgi:hypothetical protein